MSQLKTLLKVDILNTLAINSFKNSRKNKAKSVKPVVGTIITFLILLIVMCVYAAIFGTMCNEANQLSTIIIFWSWHRWFYVTTYDFFKKL